MNILITGSNGQLGNELRGIAVNYKNHLFLFTDVQDLDITDQDALASFFKDNNIELCINCAAYTAVDKAETERALCDKINIEGPANLAKACAKNNARLIHISTDFVFSGESFIPLIETKKTDPVNFYGLSKLNGELALSKELKEHFIIRTSWLYSTHGGNFVKTMIKLGESKPKLNIIVDQIGSPTYAFDLANAIMSIVESHSSAFGVYHYSNEGIASWYDFTSAIFEYSNIKTPISPIPTSEYPTPAKRPHYSVMDKSKIKEAFNITIPHWRSSLKECLSKL
ncbi:MAG: dTDP-4-dehydrorhamnose reductase [Gammaproteobacteria bacterium]|jgi:dTDP-4-dehydrorhamnose reductase